MALNNKEVWNFRALVASGTAVDTGRQLASPRMVLPFLYLALGAPIFFAGLLLPIFQLMRLVTPTLAAPMIQNAKARKWFIMASFFAMALVLAFLGVSAHSTSREWQVIIFLLAAAAIGSGEGVNSLAFNDLIGRVLLPERRKSLFYRNTALAGCATIALVWGIHTMLHFRSALDSHLILVWWVGAGVTFFAGIAITFVQETHTAQNRDQSTGGTHVPEHAKHYIRSLRDGLSEAVRVSWFRKFLSARALLLSIELAMPFYAIHAASHYRQHGGSLSIFVIFTSTALIAGGILWQRLSAKSDQSIMVVGAVLAAIGGVWAISIEFAGHQRPPALHAAVFFLVAIGAQGIISARKTYLLRLAPEDQRAYYVAAGNTLTGIVGVFFGFLLGTVAHLQGVVWPLLLIIGLNLLTSVYCWRLPQSVQN